MQEIELLRELFDKKTLNILNVIINDKSEGMYLGEVSEASEVPKATTFRIVNKLVGIDVLHEIRIKRLKLYKFRRSGRTEFLFRLFKKDVKVLQIFINQIKEISGVEAIVLHGEEEKDRANVLLIGNNIDSGKIKEICGKIREEQGFIISPLTLTAEQYDSMSRMGLYSGKKSILFEKK